MNECLYIDCMDKERGLPSLPSQSFDFCFTDPPFNINFAKDGFQRNGVKYEARWLKLYDDNREDYEEWTRKWFVEACRVSRCVVVHCSKNLANILTRYLPPHDTFYLYKTNGTAGGRSSKLSQVFPILVYGNPKNKVSHDIFVYESKWGFLSDGKFIHPCPLNEKFWLDLVSQLRPESVIDPFMGSGTTAEVCESLRIPWFGYEKEPAYEADLKERLRDGGFALRGGANDI